MIKRLILLLTTFLLIVQTIWAQSSMKDSSINASLVTIHYSFQIPQNNLRERFGNNSAIGIGYTYKTKKKWEMGIQYQFLFGNDVKDTSMLSELRTPSGGIISESGDFAFYRLLQRGHHVFIHAGYQFLTLGKNPNCGFIAQGGLGFLQHKVAFQNLNDDIPQFNARNKDYQAGYDRYTTGITLTEFIGYRHLSDNGLVNFYLGVEAIQGLTKLRRSYQVDYPVDFENTIRKDFLYGLKAGWILPIYKKPSKDFYY